MTTKNYETEAYGRDYLTEVTISTPKAAAVKVTSGDRTVGESFLEAFAPSGFLGRGPHLSLPEAVSAFVRDTIQGDAPAPSLEDQLSEVFDAIDLKFN